MTLVLRHEVWVASPPSDHPALVHEFYGSTEQEAFDAYAAHVEVDDALRTCIERGAFYGRRCTIRWSYLPKTDERAESMPRSQPTPALLREVAASTSTAKIEVAAAGTQTQRQRPMSRSTQLASMQSARQAQVGGWKSRPTPQSPAAATSAQRGQPPQTQMMPGMRARFSPQIIEGGRGGRGTSRGAMPARVVAVGEDAQMLPGHEDHDPDVCDVRTG